MKARGSILGPVVALVLALAAGCKSAPEEPPPDWQSAALPAASSTVLMEVAVLAAEKLGYPLGSGLDPTTMTAVTGWQNSLAPFKGRGFRRQAEVHFDRRPDGTHVVRVRVRKQVNQSLVRPLDLQYAEWEWVPDDRQAARALLQHIRARLAPDLEVEPRGAAGDPAPEPWSPERR